MEDEKKIPVDPYVETGGLRPAARTNKDKTEHGGTVDMGSNNVFVDHYRAARLGDYHVCPETTDKIPHVGGPIVQGSSVVFINGRPAARKWDHAQCTLEPPDERDVEFMACRPEVKAGGGGEWGAHEGAEFKAAIEPIHVECSAIHIPAKVGDIDVPTDIAKVTAVGKAGAEYGEGKLFVGATGELGFSLVEVEPQIESDPISIPGTDYEIAFGGKVSLAAGTLKLKGTAAVYTDPKKGLVIKTGGKIGAAIAGLGAEGFIALKKKHEDEPVLIFDRIVEGSSTTFYGN